MYHKIAIHKLSHAQIGKLLNGHRIRVKHGHGHEIHASAEQHKKIVKAHQKGAGTTIQFDPYQIQHHQHLRGHGDGMFGNIAKGAFKALAPVAIDALSGLAKNHIGGMGYHPHHAKHHAHRGHGEALAPAGSALYPAGYGEGMYNHHSTHFLGHGEGVRRRVGRPRGHGEGFFGDVAKGAFKTLAPIAIDAGADYLKSRAGSGARGGRKGRRGKGEGIGKRKGRRGKGDGIGEDILNGVAQYAPLALSFL
jgi:hypothetical protein